MISKTIGFRDTLFSDTPTFFQGPKVEKDLWLFRGGECGIHPPHEPWGMALGLPQLPAHWGHLKWLLMDCQVRQTIRWIQVHSGGHFMSPCSPSTVDSSGPQGFKWRPATKEAPRNTSSGPTCRWPGMIQLLQSTTPGIWRREICPTWYGSTGVNWRNMWMDWNDVANYLPIKLLLSHSSSCHSPIKFNHLKPGKLIH